MKQYFESQIKALIENHNYLMTHADAAQDNASRDAYKSMASNFWDRKCDTESHLAEWERQNVSDLSLVSGPTRVEVLSLWRNAESSVRINNPDGTYVTYTIPRGEEKTIIEKEAILKQIARDYIVGKTEYIISPDNSINTTQHEQESYSGC